MFVACLLESLTEILFFVVSAVFYNFTREDIIYVDVCVYLNEICQCRSALEFEFGDELTI
jgi:hypothetical protein